MKAQEFILNLQNAVKIYDRILFLPHEVQEITGLLSNYPKKQPRKKILLLSEDAVYNHLNGIDWIQLDEESCAALRQLYYTYEFSDKFRILSVNNNFGTIWNYTKIGLLSPEETAFALLE